MSHYAPLDEMHIRKAKQMFTRGIVVKEIAKKLGVCEETMRRKLKVTVPNYKKTSIQNVNNNNKRYITLDDPRIILAKKRFVDGKSLAKIVKETQLAYPTIRKKLMILLPDYVKIAKSHKKRNNNPYFLDPEGEKVCFAKELFMNGCTIRDAAKKVGVDHGILSGKLKQLLSKQDFEKIKRNNLCFQIDKVRLKGVKNCDIKLASIIAHLQGDGYISRKCLGYVNTNFDLINAFKGDIEDVFNVRGSVRFEKRISVLPGGYISKKGIYRYRIRSIKIAEYLKDKIKEQKTFIKTVEQKQAFIRALFDDEGSVGKKRISIGMTNKPLLLLIKAFLLELGIKTGSLWWRKPRKKGWKDYYVFTISEKNKLQTFYEKIGFLSKTKQHKLKQCLKNIKYSITHYPENKIKKAVKMVKTGMTYVKAAESTELPPDVVMRHCIKSGVHSPIKYIKYSNKTKNEVIQQIKEGISYRKIAEEKGISINTVVKWAIEKGVSRHRKKPFTFPFSIINHAVEDIHKGKTKREVAEQLGVSTSTIRRWEKRLAQEPNPPQFPTQAPDHHIFSNNIEVRKP